MNVTRQPKLVYTEERVLPDRNKQYYTNKRKVHKYGEIKDWGNCALCL